MKMGVNRLKMHAEIARVLKGIGTVDLEAMETAQQRLDSLTKPPGSLGRLEALAVQLDGIAGKRFPVGARKKVIVMAADHGVTAEGISAFPQEVTAQMVANFINNGAAINVLARLAGADVRVVDIGVAADQPLQGATPARVRPGTGNFARELAMSREEVEQAMRVGISVALEEIDAGVQVLATGEMGIGNTTASSAVMSALTGYAPAHVVGPGTGLEEAELQKKVAVVERALARHEPDARDPLDVLSKVGGLEIAGLAGLIMGAASRRCPVILDGFISTVAALAAVKMNARILNFLIPSHLSQEPGHGLLLEYMELKPYLQMNMRLGEGTGAALAMHLVEAAAAIMQQMATFDEAGVSGKEEAAAGEDLSCPTRTDEHK